VKHLVCCSVLVCICVGSSAGADDATKTKEDGKKMQGTWKPVAAELGGKPFPQELLKTMKLVMTDGKYTVTVGEQTDEGTVKLEPSKEPRAMDIVGTKGPNQSKKFPAIYEITDTTLRICYDLSGKERPKEFKTKADSQLFLVEYKRQKPEKD
jgi:uncharacterized protein (TIGR03067 family)